MTEFEQLVFKLFHDGHGQGGIALILKCRSSIVAKALKDMGLSRTAAEAREIRRAKGMNAGQSSASYRTRDIEAWTEDQRRADKKKDT